MKKKVLISSFDLAVGGVERSLLGLLSRFDYDKYDVDLMLFRHEGDFMALLPKGPRLLPENPQYATFRKSIKEMLREGHPSIALTRLIAKPLARFHGRIKRCAEPGYLTIQYGWALSVPLLPQLSGEYDAAISFLWPHYFVGRRVRAKKKIGWIHTDYSQLVVHRGLEERMWSGLDEIVAVSEDCRRSFVRTFPGQEPKTTVVENILSPAFVREQAQIGTMTELRRKPERTVIVTVARLTYAKGLDTAVLACKRLLELGCDIEWHIVGYGPLEAELIELIREQGLEERFFLRGKKTNPYPYIRDCDLYVQPSRYEGKAVTVREAQMLGKPVVITDFPTAGSQVRNGEDGLIVPMGVEGVVDGIRRLLSDAPLRKRLTEHLAHTDYGNESEIGKLYELLEK